MQSTEWVIWTTGQFPRWSHGIRALGEMVMRLLLLSRCEELKKPSTKCMGHMAADLALWWGTGWQTQLYLGISTQNVSIHSESRHNKGDPLNEHMTTSCQLPAEQQNVLGRFPAAVWENVCASLWLTRPLEAPRVHPPRPNPLAHS